MRRWLRRIYPQEGDNRHDTSYLDAGQFEAAIKQMSGSEGISLSLWYPLREKAQYLSAFTQSATRGQYGRIAVVARLIVPKGHEDQEYEHARQSTARGARIFVRS